MRRLCKRIATYLGTLINLSTELIDVLAYGLDLFIYTVLSTIGLLLTGVLFSRFFESIIIILVYYINQTLGGGFHATSHMRCFLVMIIGELVSFAILHILNFFPISTVLSAASLFALWRYPLVLHPNKRYLGHKASAFIRRSRKWIMVQTLAFTTAVGMDVPQNYINAISVAFLIASFSRIVAVKQYKDSSLFNSLF